MHLDFFPFLPASYPSMDEKQFNTATTYEMEPVKTITIPHHYSIDEICGVIRSEMGRLENVTAATQDDALTSESPTRDISTIIISSGEFS